LGVKEATAGAALANFDVDGFAAAWAHASISGFFLVHISPRVHVAALEMDPEEFAFFCHIYRPQTNIKMQLSHCQVAVAPSADISHFLMLPN
jgi:hypothetical protein